MAVTRREFLKLAGLAGAAVAAGTVGSMEGRNKIKSIVARAKEKTMVCPFCSLGCTINVYFRKGKPVYVSGNPEDPRTGGSICSKALVSVDYIEKLTGKKEVKYRKPFSSAWETIGWDDAVRMIAERIRKTRDESFVPFDGPVTVNRTDGIAVTVGSSLSNEEAYLVVKMSRILGIPYTASESYIRGELSDEMMSAQFGLPGSTNPFSDISYASSVLIVGANPARNASVMMKHIMNVKKNGGKIITVDPVKTETASVSDIHCRIRPGTDSVFLMGMVNNAIINGRYDKEYISEYTDASCIVSQEAVGAKSSSKTKIEYERDARGNPKKDDELRHIRTVFQILKESLSKYTPVYVSEITGCSPSVFLEAAETFTLTRDRNLSGAVIFGSGISASGQGEPIRLLSILQMLLGNIGRSGGGIYYLKSGPNGLGVSLQVPSPSSLPGGIPLPSGEPSLSDDDFFSYIKNRAPVSNDQMSVNVRQNLKQHMTSLLKSWFGDSAKAETRYNFDWLPKAKKTADSFQVYLSSSKVKGLLCFGADGYRMRIGTKGVSKAFSGLEWLVVTGEGSSVSEFWNADPSKNKTEVFFIPSIPALFKQGSFTGSDRTTLWNEGNDAFQGKGEFAFIRNLFSDIRKVSGGGVLPEPIMYSKWDDGYTPESVLREMSGQTGSGKDGVSSYETLKDDGSTSCGNLLFAGIFDRKNQASRRGISANRKKFGLFTSWGYSLPNNTRVLYNRASLDRNGQPFSDDRSPIRLETGDKRSDKVNGAGSPKEINPFIFNRDGVAYMFLENQGTGLPVVDADNKKSSGRKADGSVIISGLTCGEFLAGNFLYSESVLSGVCEIPAENAKSGGIADGDSVTVKSPNGSAVFRAGISSRLADVCVARGKNAFALLPEGKYPGALPSCVISRAKNDGKGGNV
jgi:formate dehydrogenase major subunit